MSDTPLFHYTFDDFALGEDTIAVIETSEGARLEFHQDGAIHTLLDAHTDQWGVWFTFGAHQIAQEFETRTFIDALIAGLTRVKEMTHLNPLAATETVLRPSPPTPEAPHDRDPAASASDHQL